MNEELATNAELEDSGCIQDDPEIPCFYDESVQRINLLDLSDDVLLDILKYCQARDLKALGFSCQRLAYLICDHTLWSHVDVRSHPCGEDRLQWYISLLNSGTTDLLVNGYAREAKLEEEARERAKSEPSTSKDPRANAPKKSLDNDLKTIDPTNYGIGPEASCPAAHTESPRSPNASYPVRLPATYCTRGTSSLRRPRISNSPLPSSSEVTATMTISRDILSRLIDRCPNLTCLSLDYCNIDCHLTKVSMFPPRLRKLSLVGSRCYNLPIDRSFLYRIHEYLPRLEEVDVSSCNWLAPSCLLPLSRLTQLVVLRARSCGMLAEFVAYASLATRYGFTKLRVLDVRYSPVADSEVSSLGWLPCLEELYLSAVDDLPTAVYVPQGALIEPWELNEPEYFKQRAAEAQNATPTPNETSSSNATSSPNATSSNSSTSNAASSNASDPDSAQRRDVSFEIFDSLDQERCNVSVFTITVNHHRPQPGLASVLAILRETERARERAVRRTGSIIANRVRACREAGIRRRQRMEQEEENGRNEDEQMAENLIRMRENVERMAENLERMSQLVDADMENDGNDDGEDNIANVGEGSAGDSREDNSENKNGDADSKSSSNNEDKNKNVGEKLESNDEMEIPMNLSNDEKAENDGNASQQKDRKRRNNDVEGQIDMKKHKMNDNDYNNRLVFNIDSHISYEVKIKINDSKKDQSNKKSNSSSLKSKPSSKNENGSSTSDSKPSTSQSEPSTSQSEPSSSQSEPSTSQSEPSTSQNRPSFSSQNEFCASFSEPSTSQNAPSTSRNAPSTSQNAPSTSQNAPSTSQNAPSTSQNAASTSQNAPSTSHDEPSTSEGPKAKYVKFRTNRPPVVIEQAEEQNRPLCEGQLPPNPAPGRADGMFFEENDDGFPFICVDLGRQAPRSYQVSIAGSANEHLRNQARGQRPARMLNMIRNIFYAPPPVLGPRSLITDTAIRHFGRENNQDIIHIGPNGALIRGGPEANRGRPKKSKLRKLVCTGYNGVTNSSLTHLAEAAPDLEFIDFSGTRVNQDGVNSFKVTRPDCEVVYDNGDAEKKDKKDKKDKNDG